MLVKILKLLNLLDEKSVLSITNLFMYIVLTKVILSPFDWSGAVILISIVVAYMLERVEAGKIKYKELDNQTSRVETIIKELNNSIKVLQDNAEVTNKILNEDRKTLSSMEGQLQDQIKVVEEAKTMLQANKVASTFKRHQL